MIKKLHYVWLGGNPLPANVKDCINSWKRHCPDWEIIQWSEANFDIKKFRWVNEAIRAKKYAFAADFIRLYVLNLYGGGYLDTDVQILRPIENVIDASFVSGIENHAFGTGELERDVTEKGLNRITGKPYSKFCLQAGFMYSEPSHPFIQQCIKKIYDSGNKSFLSEDGTNNCIIIDWAMMQILKNKYNIIYRDVTQHLNDDIKIYDSSVFATRKSKNNNSYLIHWFDQSWRTDCGFSMKLKKFVKKHMFFIFRKI